MSTKLKKDKGGKNDPFRFEGDGITFKGKLIGSEAVSHARGDRMCAEAMARLKSVVKASGEHKQRISLTVSLEGIKVFDEKTHELMCHHPVHRISFISQDQTDPRAFGYVSGSLHGGHSFIAIKTEKAAAQIVIALRDLFQVVLEMKQHEMKRRSGSTASSHQLNSGGGSKNRHASSSSSVSANHENACETDAAETVAPADSVAETPADSVFTEDQSSTSPQNLIDNQVEPVPTEQPANVQNVIVDDLLDLQTELDCLQKGIDQIEGEITNAEAAFGADPFGSTSETAVGGTFSSATTTILESNVAGISGGLSSRYFQPNKVCLPPLSSASAAPVSAGPLLPPPPPTSSLPSTPKRRSQPRQGAVGMPAGQAPAVAAGAVSGSGSVSADIFSVRLQADSLNSSDVNRLMTGNDQQSAASLTRSKEFSSSAAAASSWLNQTSSYDAAPTTAKSQLDFANAFDDNFGQSASTSGMSSTSASVPFTQDRSFISTSATTNTLSPSHLASAAVVDPPSSGSRPLPASTAQYISSTAFPNTASARGQLTFELNGSATQSQASSQPGAQGSSLAPLVGIKNSQLTAISNSSVGPAMMSTAAPSTIVSNAPVPALSVGGDCGSGITAVAAVVANGRSTAGVDLMSSSGLVNSMARASISSATVSTAASSSTLPGAYTRTTPAGTIIHSLPRPRSSGREPSSSARDFTLNRASTIPAVPVVPVARCASTSAMPLSAAATSGSSSVSGANRSSAGAATGALTASSHGFDAVFENARPNSGLIGRVAPLQNSSSVDSVFDDSFGFDSSVSAQLVGEASGTCQRAQPTTLPPNISTHHILALQEPPVQREAHFSAAQFSFESVASSLSRARTQESTELFEPPPAPPPSATKTHSHSISDANSCYYYQNVQNSQQQATQQQQIRQDNDARLFSGISGIVGKGSSISGSACNATTAFTDDSFGTPFITATGAASSKPGEIVGRGAVRGSVPPADKYAALEELKEQLEEVAAVASQQQQQQHYWCSDQQSVSSRTSGSAFFADFDAFAAAAQSTSLTAVTGTVSNSSMGLGTVPVNDPFSKISSTTTGPVATVSGDCSGEASGGEIDGPVLTNTFTGSHMLPPLPPRATSTGASMSGFAARPFNDGNSASDSPLDCVISAPAADCKHVAPVIVGTTIAAVKSSTAENTGHVCNDSVSVISTQQPAGNEVGGAHSGGPRVQTLTATPAHGEQRMEPLIITRKENATTATVFDARFDAQFPPDQAATHSVRSSGNNVHGTVNLLTEPSILNDKRQAAALNAHSFASSGSGSSHESAGSGGGTTASGVGGSAGSAKRPPMLNAAMRSNPFCALSTDSTPSDDFNTPPVSTTCSAASVPCLGLSGEKPAQSERNIVPAEKDQHSTPFLTASLAGSSRSQKAATSSFSAVATVTAPTAAAAGADDLPSSSVCSPNSEGTTTTTNNIFVSATSSSPSSDRFVTMASGSSLSSSDNDLTSSPPPPLQSPHKQLPPPPPLQAWQSQNCANTNQISSAQAIQHRYGQFSDHASLPLHGSVGSALASSSKASGAQTAPPFAPFAFNTTSATSSGAVVSFASPVAAVLPFTPPFESGVAQHQRQQPCDVFQPSLADDTSYKNHIIEQDTQYLTRDVSAAASSSMSQSTLLPARVAGGSTVSNPFSVACFSDLTKNAVSSCPPQSCGSSASVALSDLKNSENVVRQLQESSQQRSKQDSSAEFFASSVGANYVPVAPTEATTAPAMSFVFPPTSEFLNDSDREREDEGFCGSNAGSVSPYPTPAATSNFDITVAPSFAQTMEQQQAKLSFLYSNNQQNQTQHQPQQQHLLYNNAQNALPVASSGNPSLAFVAGGATVSNHTTLTMSAVGLATGLTDGAMRFQTSDFEHDTIVSNAQPMRRALGAEFAPSGRINETCLSREASEALTTGCSDTTPAKTISALSGNVLTSEAKSLESVDAFGHATFTVDFSKAFSSNEFVSGGNGSSEIQVTPAAVASPLNVPNGDSKPDLNNSGSGGIFNKKDDPFNEDFFNMLNGSGSAVINASGHAQEQNLDSFWCR